MPSRFELGTVVATRAALDALSGLGDPLVAARLIGRHHAGDWGDIPAEDVPVNEEAVRGGGRLISSYKVPQPRSKKLLEVWVITEADRSATTILLPGDY